MVNRLIVGFDSHSLPAPSHEPALHRRPQSGDWSHLSGGLHTLSLDDLKEPSTSRRHTMSIRPDEMDLFTRKVPTRTRAAIEKVVEAVSKMGGQIQTHVQDNGGPITVVLSDDRCNVGCTRV